MTPSGRQPAQQHAAHRRGLLDVVAIPGCPGNQFVVLVGVVEIDDHQLFSGHHTEPDWVAKLGGCPLLTGSFNAAAPLPEWLAGALRNGIAG